MAQPLLTGAIGPGTGRGRPAWEPRPIDSAVAFRLLVDAAALGQWRDRVEHAPWSAQTCSVDPGGPVRKARDVGVPEEEI